MFFPDAEPQEKHVQVYFHKPTGLKGHFAQDELKEMDMFAPGRPPPVERDSPVPAKLHPLEHIQSPKQALQLKGLKMRPANYFDINPGSRR